MSRYAQKTEVPSDRSRAEIEQTALFSWIAGLFEGEGTISITRSGHRGYTRPLVALTSTDRSMIDIIQSRWPGRIRVYTPRGNARTAYTWTIDVRGRIARFIFDILPHLRSERVIQKAWLVLEDIGARQQGAKGKDYLAACHERRERMRSLNKRGVQ